MANSNVWALVPAAGKGTRFSAQEDKLLVSLEGIPVLSHTVNALLSHSQVSGLVLVVHPDNKEAYQTCLEPLKLTKPIKLVEGGMTRRESVYLGLSAVPGDCGYVLVHDAARPLVSSDILTAGIERLKRGERAIVTSLPIFDTVKQSNEGNAIAGTLNREYLWRAQTPQFFERQTLLSAHASVSSEESITDDSQLVELSNLCQVGILRGEEKNLKITRPEDIALAKFWLGLN